MASRKHDIERYIRGEMTPSEMYALEKEALQDPFLSDALEGAGHAAPENFVFDLHQIRSSVHQRTKFRKQKIIPLSNWAIGIAASLLLLAVASIYIVRSINDQQQHKSLALKEESTSAASPEKEQAQNQDSVEEQVQISQEQKNSSVTSSQPVGEKEEKQPSSAPAAPRETQGYLAQTEPILQSEANDTDVQNIIAIDLTEEPQEIERNQGGAIARAKQTAIAETSRNEVLSQTTKVLHGKVTSSEDGSALPGVNVLVKGTSIGTVTDAEGNYQIPVSDLQQPLVFAFIGMKPEEIKPAGKTVLDVQLSPDFSQLSEIVVTGYADDAKAESPPTLEFAEPQGGRQAFQQYLEQKMHYPEHAIENKVEGRVTVQFTVGANGQLEDFKILKGLGYGCDDEVIRLIKEGPAWSPSKRNAQPVPEKVKVRLKFDIPEKQ